MTEFATSVLDYRDKLDILRRINDGRSAAR